MNALTPVKHNNPRINAYIIADEQWTALAQDLWKYSSDFNYTLRCSELYTARCKAESQLSVIEYHMARRVVSSLESLLATYGECRDYYQGLSADYHYNYDNRSYVKHFEEASSKMHLAALPLFTLGFTLSDLDRLWSVNMSTMEAQGDDICARYYSLTAGDQECK